MRVRAGLLVLALALGFVRAGGAAPPERPPNRSEIESLVRRYYVDPTDRTIKIRGLDFFRISGGRIVELYRVFDACDFLSQLGVNCPPNASAGANRGP